MSEIGRLWVSIGAKTDEFNKGVQGIGQRMQTLGGQFSTAGMGLTKGITLPAIAAGVGLFALAQKTANAGDEIQKMALRTGMSTIALSEYKHAAELSGASLDTVEKAVKRMQKNLYDADQGLATATRSLDALGLSVDDLRGLAPEEQFNRIAMALADIEDPSIRAALAQEAFGRAGTQLLPMLANGADGLAALRQEAHELGIVFDQEAADAAAKFNDDLDRLKKGFAGVFQELGMKLIPIFVDRLIPALQDRLIPAVQRLVDGIIRLGQWFNNLSPIWQKVIGFAIGFAVALGPILLVVGKLISAIGAIIGILSVKLIIIGLVIAAVIAVGVAIYNWVKNNEEAMATISAVWGAIKDAAVEIWGAIQQTMQVVGDAIRVFWDKHGAAIMASLKSAWEIIKVVIVGTLEFLKHFILAILAVMRGDWEGAWKHIQAACVAIVNALATAVVAILRGLWNGIKSVISGIHRTIVDGIQAAANFIIGLAGQAFQWGVNIVQGLIGGIQSMAGALWDAVKNTVGNAVEAIKDFLGISSPSKLFEGFGKNIGEGFAIGIKGSTDFVSHAAVGMAGAAVPAVSGGGGSSVNIDMEGLFAGAHINIGSEQQAQTLAREIWNMACSRAKSEGVAM